MQGRRARTSRWKKGWLATWSCLGVSFALGGCIEPIEPGSDLPDNPPQAELGDPTPAIISGTFRTTTELTTSSSPMPIPADYLIVFTQEGEIPSGEATVSTELRFPETPEVIGPMSESPAAISEQGNFSTLIGGILLPKEMFMGFAMEDVPATLNMMGNIEGDDCVTGGLVLSFSVAGMSVEAKGDFAAVREGTTPMCGDDMSSTGGDQ